MNPAMHAIASRLLLAWLAAALTLSSPASAAPQDDAVQAQDSSDPPELLPADEDDDDATPDSPSTNSPSSSTNSTPATPDTNAPPSRPARRSSRRSPERSGLRDWRSSSRSPIQRDGSTNGPAKTDYAYFQLVSDRNIFNAARVPNRPDRPRSTEPRRQPKVESVSLVGTLRYEKGSLAFFDGSSPDFKKALRPGDSIAGHRILSVTDSTVRLVVNDAPIDLKVGSQIRREDEGDWKAAEGVTLGPSSPASSSPSASSNTASASSPASTPSSAASSGSSGGGAEEILRRLRERRAQENKP